MELPRCGSPPEDVPPRRPTHRSFAEGSPVRADAPPRESRAIVRKSNNRAKASRATNALARECTKGKGILLQGIPQDHLAAGRNLMGRRGSREGPYFMPCFGQAGNETTPQVAAAASDKDRPSSAHPSCFPNWGHRTATESMTALGPQRKLGADVGLGALILVQKHNLGSALLLGGLGKTVQQIG